MQFWAPKFVIKFNIDMLSINNSGRSVAWFVLALAASLIVYSIARNWFWTSNIDCGNLNRYRDLEGEAYLLNRQLSICRARTGNYFDNSIEIQR